MAKGRKKATKKSGRKPCQKANGRLKKGYRYGKNGTCVKAKPAKKARKSRRSR